MQLQSLSEQLKISDREIEERKRLLGITPDHLQILSDCRRSILPQLDEIIEEFYAGQVEAPEIRSFIEDPATLSRLKGAMKDYIATLFGGDYGERYVNSRLRIGMVHARIGVQPMLYVASVHQLAGLLSERLSPREFSPLVKVALDKILLFDLVLVFETYIQGLVDEASVAKDELAAYAQNLERLVGERTASLKTLAETDDLTGLKNRRALIAALNDEIGRIRATAGSFAVAFLDVDKFKQVNDRHGHLAGDRVLQQVAQAFRASAPDPERVYRYGGDEFVAIFPGLRSNTAPQAAALIKRGIEDQLDGAVSVSLGVADFSQDDPPTVETILTSIDGEMYKRKMDGAGAPAPLRSPAAGAPGGPEQKGPRRNGAPSTLGRSAY